MTWRSAVFDLNGPFADAERPIESPQDAIDLVQATVRACQRTLHGPFTSAGDAVLLGAGVDQQLRRAVAAGGELTDPASDREQGWFEARVTNYLTGHEWVDGFRVQRCQVADHSDLLGAVMATARKAREKLRAVVTAVLAALEPWPGMEQSCMTREGLAAINDALLSYDAAATAHYRLFALFREVRTAEIQHAWQSVATEPDIPVFQPPGVRN